MTSSDTALAHPITEDDIANFLVHNPEFFERHAALLASVQLSSGLAGRAVSLQERQAELLRDKNKALEQRIVEMMRHGQENSAIGEKMQAWSRQLLLAAQPQDIPGVITSELQKQFLIPQAAIKVWGVDAAYAELAFACGVRDIGHESALSLALPLAAEALASEALALALVAFAALAVALVAVHVRVVIITTEAPAALVVELVVVIVTFHTGSR
jgi:uncharacterized protein YigA (DUF484 family)